MATAVARLQRRAEFLRVAAARRKWAAPGLVLQAARIKGAGKGGDELRVGFTVTKKVGNAVVRNRIKRRLRALAAEVMPESAKAGFDYVLIGRQGSLDRPFPDLKRDLLKALAKLGALKEPEEEREPTAKEDIGQP